jgi:hypothetical protein
MPYLSVPITSYCYLLDRQIPFAFSRWGDGEWQALLGYSGANCDGQVYTGALRADLTRVLEDRPRYLLGLQPLAVRVMGDAIHAWLKRRRLNLPWVNADVLAHASIQHDLTGFIESLARRRVVLIGPPHLQALTVFPLADHIPVPPLDAYTVYPALYAHCVRALQRYDEGPVVLISAGLSANLLVHDLHRVFPTRTILDCGSLWDPYVGKVTRKYHKRLIAQLCA